MIKVGRDRRGSAAGSGRGRVGDRKAQLLEQESVGGRMRNGMRSRRPSRLDERREW